MSFKSLILLVLFFITFSAWAGGHEGGGDNLSIESLSFSLDNCQNKEICPYIRFGNEIGYQKYLGEGDILGKGESSIYFVQVKKLRIGEQFIDEISIYLAKNVEIKLKTFIYLPHISKLIDIETGESYSHY